MTSILPQLEGFHQIPRLHERYAKAVLTRMIENISQSGEAEIGITNDVEGCWVAFDSDEFENALIELRYKKYKFSIKITDNKEGMGTSRFFYYIPNGSEMYTMIPEELIEKMDEVAFTKEPI